MSEAYALLDHGEGRKLESFGGVILDRPAPQATGPRRYPKAWGAAHASFLKGSGWRRLRPFDEPWRAKIDGIVLELALHAQGQVGLFPEQGPNWRWLRDAVASADRDLTMLNVFAYTGGATIAPLTVRVPHRVEVCHLDGSKGAVTIARRNTALNDLGDAPVRWLTDDALAFMKREKRRGRRYDGIVLDPPAFGRGPDGGQWKLADSLPDLLALAADLLSERPLLMLLSWHDPGLVSARAVAMMREALTGKSISSVRGLALVLPCRGHGMLAAGRSVRVLF
ncbi:MAG TPA: class I SAM-dependent methyltransferase [bacterium]|nr:class I SAM-dependent methyltransferase [bacterium]